MIQNVGYSRILRQTPGDYATWLYSSVEYMRLNAVQGNGSIVDDSIQAVDASPDIATMNALIPISLARMALKRQLSTAKKAEWDEMIDDACDYLISLRYDGSSGGYYTNGNINLLAASAFLHAYHATGRVANQTAYTGAYAFMLSPGGSWATTGYGRVEVVAGADSVREAFLAEYGGGAVNVNPNPGFETNADYWFAASLTLNRVTSGTIVGNGSAEIVVNGQAAQRVVICDQASGSLSETANPFYAVPKTKYTVAGKIYMPVPLTGGNFTISIIERDGKSGSLVANPVSSAISLTGADADFIDFSYSWTTNVATRAFSVRLQFNSCTGTARIDNVNITGVGLDHTYLALQLDHAAELALLDPSADHLALLHELSNHMLNEWVNQTTWVFSRKGGTRLPSPSVEPPFLNIGALAVLAKLGARSDIDAMLAPQWAEPTNGTQKRWGSTERTATSATVTDAFLRDTGTWLGVAAAVSRRYPDATLHALRRLLTQTVLPAFSDSDLGPTGAYFDDAWIGEDATLSASRIWPTSAVAHLVLSGAVTVAEV